MKFLFLSLMSTLLVLTSCTKAKPVEKEPLNTTSSLLSPMKVTLTELSRTEKTATIVASVERMVGLKMPFAARLEFPVGVRLIKGRSTFELAANAEAETKVETLVLEFDSTPSTDVTLFVDGENEAMGFHYQVPYRFGRPEPVVEAPKATGPSVKKGDKDLGPSIPIP